MTSRHALALRTRPTMGRRGTIVPLPTPLARAVEALRRVQPPRHLEEKLRARLMRAADAPRQPRKPRLIVIGGVLLALAFELSPLLAAAQPRTAAPSLTHDLVPRERLAARACMAPPEAVRGRSPGARRAHVEPATGCAPAGTRAGFVPSWGRTGRRTLVPWSRDSVRNRGF